METLQETAIHYARYALLTEGYCEEDAVRTDKMYIVWFCKTLQNWKALVSGTDIKEYIEVTYNGDKDETYVNIYNKTKECSY